MSKAERTRQFIIEQAAPIFNQRGIAGTAMSDIMAATRMAKGGLYGHFESKEDLAYAIVDHHLGLLAAALTEAVGRAETARGKLFAYLEFFRHPLQFPLPGGCPILNFGVESDDTDPVVRGKVKVLIEAAQAKAAAIIRQGIKRGEFKASFDARSFSILMFSAIEGGVLIGRVLDTNNQMGVVVGALKKMIEAELA